MFEHTFGKCGGCLGGIFFPWSNDKYQKTYNRKSDSNLNGYLDMDRDDPFAMDDETVSLQANSHSSYHETGWTDRKENYYRDMKPHYQKSSSSTDKKGYNKGTAQASGHPQRPSKSQQQLSKKKKSTHKPTAGDGDEFEKFLQAARQKSDDMKDEVESYLKFAEDNADDVNENIVTSQPNNPPNSEFDSNVAPPTVPDTSLLD